MSWLVQLKWVISMIVDRLTDEECLFIMNKLLGLHYNKAFAQFIINESTLQREGDFVKLKFPELHLSNGPKEDTKGCRMEDRCILADFEAKVFISGRQPVCVDKVNTLHRTLMFNKFGNTYLKKLQEYLTDKARKQYARALNSIDTELYNIRGERLPLPGEIHEPEA